MIHLDDEHRKHIDNSHLNGMSCFVATASNEGEPDMGPKGSMMVFDDQSLAFWERSFRITLKNLEENPRIVAYYRNPKEAVNWRFHGVATIHTDGSIRDEVMARTISVELEKDPERKGVAVVIRVDKIMSAAGVVLQER